MYHRWLGLSIGLILAIVWTGVGLAPKSKLALYFIPVLAILQSMVGYWCGKRYEQKRTLAYHDSLTGLLVNRRFFELMGIEVERARRNDYFVTLMVIDLDDFKKYNDSFGHIAGDRLLCKFAELLHRNVRSHDLVGRWGGEEFVVLLPHTSTELGVLVGKRIRESVHKELEGITVSIGLATFPTHAASADELAAKADGLMYEAKKQKDCMLTGSLELLKNERV